MGKSERCRPFQHSFGSVGASSLSCLGLVADRAAMARCVFSGLRLVPSRSSTVSRFHNSHKAAKANRAMDARNNGWCVAREGVTKSCHRKV